MDRYIGPGSPEQQAMHAAMKAAVPPTRKFTYPNGGSFVKKASLYKTLFWRSTGEWVGEFRIHAFDGPGKFVEEAKFTFRNGALVPVTGWRRTYQG